jgi:RNA polymerase sigma-70 factor (ECF subfamily)
MVIPYSSFEDEAADAALLAAVRAGDGVALGVLLDRHRRGLELYCYLMLGDRLRARVAMREIALAAWEEGLIGPSARSVRIWLFRIAVRVCGELGGQER